ncbi:hypothetical protein FISHEDRAFT_70919 [Fistulina hepatica ATCC 64428]|uniref:Uncharacterized protein n=1 Tax=Fistulina hepatica ATCC 64428 TaxID=1128425 RepID=A0A0D7AHR4_9AGAR|nr:hypothetical protein FISHEDRAFT_70919 [Fistulina hepatica ATCC 64428]
MSSTSGMFNVQEPTGVESERVQTTAAVAQSEAHSGSTSRQIERGAAQVQRAAGDVAATAQFKGPGFTGVSESSLDELERNVQQTTNDAAVEGKHDVEQMKQAAASYLDQAKSYTNTALDHAQNYIPTSVGGHAPSLQAGATALTADAKEAFSTAQRATQPQIDRVMNAMQGSSHERSGAADSGTTSATDTVNSAATHVQDFPGIKGVTGQHDAPASSTSANL